ncbi:MAG: hypothetical protein IT489_00280 [Gammaproteobacteria bacterium]|nr:hypothetical protein [Gammaproteobacteria bacterium]
MAEVNETTPYGIWRYGDDYRKAAVYVLTQYPNQPFVPYFSLLGQSIELSLKAFLLTQGVALEDLKNKFRHDLKALVEEARKRGIESNVTLTDAHWAVIVLMNDEYKTKRYHYIRTGMMIVPDLRLVLEAAEQLCGGLESICKERG